MNREPFGFGTTEPRSPPNVTAGRNPLRPSPGAIPKLENPTRQRPRFADLLDGIQKRDQYYLKSRAEPPPRANSAEARSPAGLRMEDAENPWQELPHRPRFVREVFRKHRRPSSSASGWSSDNAEPGCGSAPSSTDFAQMVAFQNRTKGALRDLSSIASLQKAPTTVANTSAASGVHASRRVSITPSALQAEDSGAPPSPIRRVTTPGPSETDVTTGLRSLTKSRDTRHDASWRIRGTGGFGFASAKDRATLRAEIAAGAKRRGRPPTEGLGAAERRIAMAQSVAADPLLGLRPASRQSNDVLVRSSSSEVAATLRRPHTFMREEHLEGTLLQRSFNVRIRREQAADPKRKGCMLRAM